MAELHDLTALEQGAAVAAGEVSPAELVEHYLERIDRLGLHPLLVKVGCNEPRRVPLAKTQQEIPNPGTGLRHQRHPPHQVSHLAELFVEEVDRQVETVQKPAMEVLDLGDVGVTTGGG